MRLLSTRIMQMRPLCKRMMTNEVAKHESNVNEAAENKNNGK